MTGARVLAETPDWGLPIVWASLPLVGVLLLAAMIIAYVKRRCQKSGSDRSPSGEQLSHFRVLYERGELSREEFQRIRGQLGARMRKEMDLPAAPAEEVPLAEPDEDETTGK